nr:nucleic acid-binding, OB-fold protein [Tanacetum cinerariifolium]
TAASETITAASTTITAAESQVLVATLTAAPARVTATPNTRRKGEPKPLKKQAQIEKDEKYAKELEAELNKNIDWDEVIDHVKKKAKEDPIVKKYQALKRKPQTEAQAKKNMMLYLKNVAGFKIDCFKGIEDLEALWSLVKERFSTTKPNNFSNDFLLIILGAMFEKLDTHAQIWKNQRSVHGPAKVKGWKLLESRGVQIITFTTTQLILLVEKKYPTHKIHSGLDVKCNVVELALWGDMARSFKKSDYDAMEKPVIIAVSSCKVSLYGSTLQLSATTATHYYLNPDIPNLEEYLS